MRIEAKPRELLQAQLATFTYEQTGTETGRARNFIGCPENYSSHEYASFLRNASATETELIRDKAAAIGAFATYSSGVEALLQSVTEDRKMYGNKYVHNRPDFLGAGAFSQVFRVDEGERSYAVRCTPLAPTFDFLATGLLRAIGVPHAEQLLAFSYDKEVTVSEVARGKPLHKMTQDELNSIPNAHLESLLTTAVRLANRLVVVDGNIGNFIYDSAAGFTIIDFRPRHPARIIAPPIDSNIAETTGVFSDNIMPPNDITDRIQRIVQIK